MSASPSNPSSSNAPSPPNGRSSPDPPPDNDNEKHEPEDTSTSHTVTTQNKGPSASAPPRKSNNSSNNLPRTNGSASQQKPSPKSSPSFLSRLFRALVPCVSPSSRAHPPDIDLPLSSKPAAASSQEKQPEAVSQNIQPSSLQNEQQQQQEKTELPPSDQEKIPPTSTPTSNPEPSLPNPSTSEQPPSHKPSNMETSPPQPEQPSPSAPPLPVPTEANPEAVLSPRVELKPSSQENGATDINRTSTVPSNATADADDSEGTSFTEDDDIDEVNGIDDEDEDELVIRNGGAGIPIGPDGVPRPLLPPIAPQHAGRKCLVLDLDETLVHSSFKSIQQADYVVPVEIEYHWHNVYVIKRPGVDNFLKKMGEIYEVVVFTASLSKYADPVLDKLDIHQVVSHRLFRESCYNHRGNYVKDLSQLGRPIADTIILDNSPASYIFHPNNAVPVSSWFNDPHDTELTDLVPFLADLSGVDDVRGVLDGAR